jgi:hypothetical protein
MGWQVHAEWMTAALQTMSVAALRERGPFLSELAAVCVVFLSDDSLVRVSRALETLLCLMQVRFTQFFSTLLRLGPLHGALLSIELKSCQGSGLRPLFSMHVVRRLDGASVSCGVSGCGPPTATRRCASD